MNRAASSISEVDKHREGLRVKEISLASFSKMNPPGCIFSRQLDFANVTFARLWAYMYLEKAEKD